MSIKKVHFLAMASALTLAACSDSAVLSSWTQQAGTFIDEGEFGNPTQNNLLVQTGAEGYVLGLNNRFSAEVMPMVNFAFDSAKLDAEATAILREQARWIKTFPEVRFRVYGHTDLVGSASYNKSLGQRRANAVVRYLVSQGISRSRLEAVSSFGETQPLIVSDGRERKNRRTVTEVTGFVQNSSGPLDGKFARILYRQYVGSSDAKPKVTDANIAAGG